MKIRNGFVSNSSTSSFIINSYKDLNKDLNIKNFLNDVFKDININKYYRDIKNLIIFHLKKLIIF